VLQACVGVKERGKECACLTLPGHVVFITLYLSQADTSLEYFFFMRDSCVDGKLVWLFLKHYF
jgi:hypothetical protein